jgi:peptidoglycan hydrolase-like protein with peptidoglycan-binding domain
MRVRTAMTALAGVGAVVAGTLVPAAPAAAASPQCTSIGSWNLLYVPAAANGSPYCVMGQGAISTAVTTLQITMIACHGQSLAADGEFGPQTRAALIRVQRAVGAAADGVYGPETFGKMARTGGFYSRLGNFCGTVL